MRGAQRNSVYSMTGAYERSRKYPGRLPVALAQDLDVVRRLRVRPDARQLQRLRVGDGHERPVHPPAPGHADVDRVVGRYGVEVVAGGETPFRELIGAVDIVELRGAERHEHRPLSGRGALDPEAHAFDDVLHRVAPGQREAAPRLQSLAVHVGVGVVEAGTHRRAFEVDHPRRMAAPGEHLGGGPERRDDAGRDSDRFRGPRSRVESQDVAVVQDELVLAHVGGLRSRER